MLPDRSFSSIPTGHHDSGRTPGLLAHARSASPPGLKPCGVRRAQARFCQHQVSEAARWSSRFNYDAYRVHDEGKRGFDVVGFCVTETEATWGKRVQHVTVLAWYA